MAVLAILEFISLENDVFRAYAFWTGVIVLKMIAMSGITGFTRIKKKIFVVPEDYMFSDSSVKEGKFGDAEIERYRRAHRNDLENCIPFMIIGFLYVLTGPSSFVAVNMIRIGAISRIVHSISYIMAVQPWRALGFVGCLAVTVFMSLQVIMFF